MDLAALENSKAAARWTKDTKIGEGTYAVVYKATEKSTGRKVAIKKIKVGLMADGLDMSAVREVKFLRELSHPNVIALLDVFSVKQNLNLVLEYLDTDLEAVIKDPTLVFQTADIKSWMAMTLRGLEFCHRNGVLHRDLKPNNLLIASDGQLKIADFGLAREFGDPGAKMTAAVITRWYRPPELLYGARTYSSAVDIWSLGAIFVELVLRLPFLSGESDIDQLKKTFLAMGTPTEEDWPGHKDLPDYSAVPEQPKSAWWNLVASAGKEGMELVKDMMKFDPRQRITARKALYHRFFTTLPKPTPPAKLPKPLAELRPRALAPEELNGKPAVEHESGQGLKRKAAAPEDGMGRNGDKVARRLFV